jgi:hypothetical protein
MALSPDSKMRGYAEGMEKATATMKKLKAETAPSHYVEFLKVAEALTGPPVEQTPAFAKTTAYADKGLSTTLAAWASMRHSWALHAKQSVTFVGKHLYEPLPGYVEPAPAFFTALRELVDKTLELLRPLPGLNVKRWDEFQKLVTTLSGMVDKELAGKPFSEDEIELLDRFGYRIAKLQGFKTNKLDYERWPWMALIADVHSEMLSERCLEVGTGGAMPIYVIIEHKGVPQLLFGAVYSYYEFQQPIQERLTDPEWHEKLKSGKAPAMPAWTASYVAPYDVDSLIERLRQGEKVDAVLSVNAPKVDAFLETAVLPDGELVGKDNYGWALKAAAAKLGRKMVPQLMEMLRKGERGGPSTGDGVTGGAPDLAVLAELALPAAMGEEDLPELVGIAIGDDAERGWLASRTAGALQGKMLEKFLTQVIVGTQDNRRRQECLGAYVYGRDRLSKDITPHLLRAWKEGDANLRETVLGVLNAVWTPEYLRESAPPPPEATESELRGWEQQIRALVLETIGKVENDNLKSLAIDIAGHLQIAEAVPLIARTSEVGPVRRVSCALAEIGTDEAVDRLLTLASEEPVPPHSVGGQWVRGQRDLVEAWRRAKPARVAGHLRKYLSDKSLTGAKDYRVCDRAAEALAIVLPDGPGFSILDKASDRDAKIKAWKTYTEEYLSYCPQAPP